MGEESTTCSQPDPARPGADTWCAFYRPAAGSDGTELWALNVTRALAEPVTCEGSDPACIRLTSHLWTGNTIFSPAHPSVHGFDGQSLIFYSDSPPGAPEDPFRGAVRVWRPGWARPRSLTPPSGYLCYGHALAPVAVCFDDVQGGFLSPEFDLLAGSVDDPGGGPLPRVAHIRATGSMGQVLWGVALSPSGDYLAMSSAGGADVEELSVLKLGRTSDTPVVIVADAGRWQISPDGQKVYYLESFGKQSVQDESDRSGALMMADFPTGRNPTVLAERVPMFMPFEVPGEGNRGLVFLKDTESGRGGFHVIRDRTRPAGATLIEGGVEYVELSPDRRYAFLEEPMTKDGSPQGVVARMDGGGSCIFTLKPGYPVVHPVFVSPPRLMFWGDQQPERPYDTEGWYADPEDCTGRRQFSPRLGQVVAVSDGIVHGEYAADQTMGTPMTLRHMRLADGVPADGGTVIGRMVDVRLVVPRGLRHVVFTASKADAVGAGLYVYGPLP